MEETRTPGFRPQNKKITDNERVLHPRDCVKRLYVPRKEGGRGLISVEDCVNQAGRLLETYVQSSEEKILKAVETAASFKGRRRPENTQGWKEMPLYGQFAKRRSKKHGPG